MWQGILISVGFGLLIGVIGFVGAIIEAHIQAKAYNRVTGANVSWWDALWLDLRVSDKSKKGDGDSLL